MASNVARKILTSIHNWKGIPALPITHQKSAKEAIAALQAACVQFIAEMEFQERKNQEEIEKRQHQERIKRTQFEKNLDHAKLQKFRDEFHQIFVMPDSNAERHLL